MYRSLGQATEYVPWLVLNSLSRCGWSQVIKTCLLCFWSVGIKGVCSNLQFLNCFICCCYCCYCSLFSHHWIVWSPNIFEYEPLRWCMHCKYILPNFSCIVEFYCSDAIRFVSVLLPVPLGFSWERPCSCLYLWLFFYFVFNVLQSLVFCLNLPLIFKVYFEVEMRLKSQFSSWNETFWAPWAVESSSVYIPCTFSEASIEMLQLTYRCSCWFHVLCVSLPFILLLLLVW